MYSSLELEPDYSECNNTRIFHSVYYLLLFLHRLTSRLSASHVFLTDHDTKSLAHMEEDCATNNIQADIVLLDWFAPDLTPLQGAHSLRIIAGDVIYKSVLVSPFMSTVALIQQMHPMSQMLLCHVPEHGGVTHETVLAAAQALGIAIERLPREAWFNESLREHCNEEELESAGLYIINSAAQVL